MFNLIKELIGDYKDYKQEKAQDAIELEESLSKRRENINKRMEDSKSRNRKILEENIIYDEAEKVYRFEITVNGKDGPRTFSCEDRVKEYCKMEAVMELMKADQYEIWGSILEEVNECKKLQTNRKCLESK